jgi:type VI secretion system secreted protein Hcp
MAQVDYFLKIEGVAGESQDDKHKGEIDVESFSWGVTQTATMAHGGGGGAGKANFNDFNFTHHIDKSSPKLFLACASGQHIKQATFIGETSDVEGGSRQFLKYTFTDILVSSFEEGGAANGVNDASALNFADVKTEATPGTRIDITPAGIGNLMLDPKTGQVIVTDSPSGVLVSGPSLERGGGINRGVAEYALTDLLGVITGPNPCALRLDIREARQIIEIPGNLTDGAPALVAPPDEVIDTFPGTGPVKKLARHDVYWYGPTDLQLTPDDYSRDAQRLGSLQVDPSGTPAEASFDLCEIVNKHGLESIGIRIQSAMDHTSLMEEEGATVPPEPEGPPFTISPATFTLDLTLELN